MIYRRFIRPVLFRWDSEKVHHAACRLGRLPGAPAFCRAVIAPRPDPRLAVSAFGLTFPSPVGLAAGFDKNAEIVPTLAALGFGHIEVGSITALPQSGNPRPRIFRFPESEALVNRMGFPSAGVELVAPRLEEIYGKLQTIVGVNIGKTKVVPIDAAAEDYRATFRRVQRCADYFVLNVSSPNTPELRKLQERARLTELLRDVQRENTAAKPLLVKIAPDLSWAEIDDVLECCFDAGIAGIIATNTTFSREGLAPPTNEVGGMSGAPLHARAVEVVRYIYSRTSGRLPIIGVGGISSGNEVIDFLTAGATLVQLYTGLIYRGPGIVRAIHAELGRYLAQTGLQSIAEIKPKML